MTSAPTCQSIKVPYDDANLRFWRNTSVANLQPGQTATLTKNYLGYEWDEAPDNGFDPAGLVELSSTTLPVSTYLLDYGNTTGSGTATHNLTLYRAPSGALVFGAGTVYWSWGLSDNHDLRQRRPIRACSRRWSTCLPTWASSRNAAIGLSHRCAFDRPYRSDLRHQSARHPLPRVAIVTISGTASDVRRRDRRRRGLDRQRRQLASGYRRRAGPIPGRRRLPAPTPFAPAPSTTASIWKRPRPGAP